MQDNIFSKVIYKNQEDDKTKNFVNSYRFRPSPSRTRYQAWSPEISFEERFRLKRRREDEYIQEFHPEDRPILLVQEKHTYKTGKQVQFTEPSQKEHYFKVSKNTNIIDDVNEELRGQRKFGRKHTIMHGKQQEDEENSVYKVKGIEFLPEGFLELDPLLYKDQFEFESKIQEKFFSEEQRRLKALRRKQYEQRKYQKMRDVTIFLLDERKDRIIDYLEKWYFKNKRRMNNDEIRYVSELLKCDEQTMKDMQNLFLERKKYLNSKRLREYLTQHGRIKNDKLIVPQSMKQYFVRKSDPYKHIKPRLYGTDEDTTQILQKRLKNPFSHRINGSKSVSNYHNQYDDFQGDETMKKGQRNSGYDQNVFEKEYYDKDFKGLSHSQRTFQHHPSQQKKIRSFSQNRNEQNVSFDNTDDLEIYFDSEVNKILDKIENSKITGDNHRDCDVEIGKQKRLMNCKLVFNQGSQKYVDNFKNKYLDQKIQKAHKKSKMSLASTHFKKSNKKSKPEYYPEVDTFGKTTPKANPSILNSEVDSLQKNKVVKTEQEVKDIIRATIVSKKANGDTIVLQKLAPIEIGNEHYYQVIEDILQDQVRSVSIITKNDRGEILKREEIPQELVGNNYENFVVNEPSQFDGDKKVHVILQNDKGQKVSSVTIRPTVQSTQIAKVEKDQLKTGNFRKSVILERQVNNGLKRVHSLPPIFLLNNTYQQKVIENISQDGTKKITVVTTDQTGKLVCEEEVPQFLDGQRYQTVVNQDVVNEKGVRKILLETRNEKGETIATHSFTKFVNKTEQQEINKIQEKAKKTTVVTKKEKNKTIRQSQLEPLIVGKEFIRQEVQESRDNKGNRTLTIITKDQNGKVISKDEVSLEYAAEKYYSELVQDHINKHGQRQFTVITKNNRGETININKINPTVYSALGEDMIKEFDQIARGKTTIIQKENDRITYSLKPTLVGDIYYQQIIEEEIDNYGKRQITIITQNQEGDVVSQEIVPYDYFKGKEFRTLVQNNNTNNNDDQQKRNVTLQVVNENNDVIHKQTIRPLFNSIHFQNLNEFKQGRQSVMKKQTLGNKVVRTQTMRPTQAGQNYYQQMINEVIDEEGKKSVYVLTKDQKGELIDVQEIQDDVQLHDIQAEVEQEPNRGVTIVVKDAEGQQISRKVINEEPNFNQTRNTALSKITISKKSNQRTLTHTLKPTLVGNKYYSQVVKEVLDKRDNKSITVYTLNEDGDVIHEKEVDENLQGRNYQTHIANDFIDNEGQRKVTMEVCNDRGQVISVFNLIPENLHNGKEYFDGQDINDLEENNVRVSKVGKLTKKTNVLRPTVIGNEYFQHVIEEITNEKNQRQLTLVTLDQQGEEMNRQNLNPTLVSQNYHIQIEDDQQNSRGERVVTINFLNENKQKIATQKINSDFAGNVQEYFFSDFFNIFDDEGKKQSTISVKREDSHVFRSHSLRPTLIGHKYYQQIVNEIYKDNGEKQAMLVTQDENGKVISNEYIQEEMVGDFYTNIVKEVVDEQRNRVYTIETYNDKDELINTQNINPEIMDIIGDEQFDDTVLQVVNDDGTTSLYYYENRFSGANKVSKKTTIQRSKTTLMPIQEVDEYDSNDVKEDIRKNMYYEKLVNQYKLRRKSGRYSQARKSLKAYPHKSGTILVRDINRPKKISSPKRVSNFTARKISQRKNSQISGKTIKSQKNSLEQTKKKTTIRKTTGNKKPSLVEKLYPKKVTIDYSNKEEEENNKNDTLNDSDQDIIENITNSYQLNKSKTQSEKNVKNSVKQNDIVDSQEIQQDVLKVTSNKMVQNSGFFNEQQDIKQSNKQIQVDQITQDLQNEEREKDLDEHHDLLIRKSEKLRNYLDDYISTLKKSKLSQLKKDRERRRQEEFMKTTIEKVFMQEKEKLGDDIVRKIELKMKGQMGYSTEQKKQNLLDEFYEFCKQTLPKDQNYKESIMFVSLFYYFMEKKKLIK